MLISEDQVEIRKKSNNNNVLQLERNSKPIVPERPAGLARPSSLMRSIRHSIENLDIESGVGKN